MDSGVVYSLMIRLLALLSLLLILLSACGSDETSSEDPAESPTTTSLPDDGGPVETVPELEPDQVVFVWTETGGCAMAGPNCARYEVAADGTVQTFRGDESEASTTGVVDTVAVSDWLSAVAATDLAELVGRLGPGEMTAAFDGVDFVLEAPHTQLVFSSVEVEFDLGEPLFRAAFSMAHQAAEVAPLEFAQR